MIELPNETPIEYLNMPAGLQGYWWETDNMICVPVVIADRKGDGAFSQFLKDIEAKGKSIFFPTVISGYLDKLLRARGYQDGFVVDEQMGVVDGLVKPKEMPSG